MEYLVSIIIPTYNRAHLIAETLDSIIVQTYSDWECIVVDDGSTDKTEELLNNYIRKDNRIKYYQRPTGREKGANSCRNYGFELSKGKYIKWFDSDDIMLPEHIAVLVNALQKENADFVVGDCANFEEGKEINLKPYDFDRNKVEINSFLYATNQIGWITDDFLGKREILGDIRFNEKLLDGQEYNFFIRLLLQNRNGVFVNQVLTKARLHKQSLSAINRQNSFNMMKIISEIKILTLEDIYAIDDKNEINIFFLSGYMRNAFILALDRFKAPFFFKGILFVLKLKGVVRTASFILSIGIAFVFKKGYQLNKFSRS
jgi:glycosyltransferase involved in cell wall biosynthesis